jgi:nucleotide-binding universal stress UspA family protein
MADREQRMTIELKRLLVPTDFSRESHTALKYGMAIAAKFDASLHVLHVLEGIAGAEPPTWHIESRKAVEQAIEAAAWKELRGLLTAGEEAYFRAALALEWGSPFEEIIRYTNSHKIDLVTMGTHGRDGVKRLIVGSVAEHVVRHATCPVLTVRDPAHAILRP